VFDVETFERLFSGIKSLDVPIVVGLWPFDSALNAEFMANEVPGVRVPDEVLERMRGVPEGEAAVAEGIAIAREIAAALRPMVQGVHIAVPSGRIKVALDVLDGIS
jgi:homocysteine S-methyltransferase